MENQIEQEEKKVQNPEFENIDDVELIEEITNITFEKQEVKQGDQTKKFQMVRIFCPPQRLTPLKKSWDKIVTTVIENLKLQIRMNTKKKCVEIKTSEHTVEKMALSRATDFVKAFMLGFDLNDAIALLRLDDLYIESFEVKDGINFYFNILVKTLHGDHLSRAIGRISGEKGKTKYAIENATRTRIVIAENKIHVLGSYTNCKGAKDALSSLIMGSPPGKVYSQLRYISKRYMEKF